MSSPQLPNLFSFATSELSQDAVFAYLFSWAHHEWSGLPEHEVVHGLGEGLLRRLVAMAADANGMSDPIANRSDLKVKVHTQHQRIDVLVEIDDDIALVVEDKTMTGEHGKQLKVYVEALKGEYAKNGQQRDVLAVYVKTGNEAHADRKKSIPCGVCRRPDILEVMDGYPDSDNTIVEDFRRHLQALESATNDFREAKPTDWGWQAIEGYYMDLEQQLSKSKPNWGHVNNPSGRFLALWCHVVPINSMGCNLYLQIHDGTRLTIRAGSRANGKVTSKQQWRILEVCRAAATRGSAPELLVSKSGRFRGGDSAAIADVHFGEEGAGYIAVTRDGLPDLDSTVAKIKLGARLVEEVARSLDSNPIDE